MKNWLIGKDPDAGKDWRQEEKGMTEDEIIGWHHWLDGREFEQAPRFGDGQGSLACCSPWVHNKSDMTEQLNWTELRDKDGCCIMIKGSTQEEDTVIINIYAPKISQMLKTMKGEINSNTIIVGNFYTPDKPMDRSSKQKINKETEAFNDTMDKLDWYLQGISPQNSGFYLFLKFTWNILQDRSHPGSQI